MRTTLALVLLAVSVVRVGAIEAATPRPWTHVRPITPAATAMLDDAVAMSWTVRTQLNDLEQTDVVVYLTDSMSGGCDGPRAYLTFLTRAGGVRFLVIRIDRWRLQLHDIIVSVGHELQHALEVAASPAVMCSKTLAQLYRRIGWEEQAGRFESNGALAVGRRVRNELLGYPDP